MIPMGSETDTAAAAAATKQLFSAIREIHNHLDPAKATPSAGVVRGVIRKTKSKVVSAVRKCIFNSLERSSTVIESTPGFLRKSPSDMERCLEDAWTGLGEDNAADMELANVASAGAAISHICGSHRKLCSTYNQAFAGLAEQAQDMTLQSVLGLTATADVADLFYQHAMLSVAKQIASALVKLVHDHQPAIAGAGVLGLKVYREKYLAHMKTLQVVVQKKGAEGSKLSQEISGWISSGMKAPAVH
eukprot:TRINITY_DN3661_c0_g1_i2.p1 TRINITY_DN3661_c0_g1~~TRINITY_DN3661_c0_g1_i2.p1  ORF type:complete len:246 (+),score=52.14 TRINITY_DN3661_c0_g1_i2:475-1212(+)